MWRKNICNLLLHSINNVNTILNTQNTNSLMQVWHTLHAHRMSCHVTRLNVTYMFAGVGTAGRPVEELRQRQSDRRNLDHLSPTVVSFSSLLLKTIMSLIIVYEVQKPLLSVCTCKYSCTESFFSPHMDQSHRGAQPYNLVGMD